MRVAGLVTVAYGVGIIVMISALHGFVDHDKQLSSGQWAENSRIRAQNKPSHRARSAHNTTSDRVSTSQTRKVFYSTLRPDRAGAVIQDMLLAHAHAFSNSRTYYGGACPPAGSTTANLTRQQVSALLTRLGLEDVLRVACPGEDGDPHDAPIVDSRYYRRDYVRTCTPEWQKFVRSKMVAGSGRPRGNDEDNANSRPLRVVVHIRRGDVTPCDPLRYLPNSYYLELIRRYAPRHAELTIYSQRDSVEPWDDFANYSLNLADDEGDDVIAAWEAMMNADVLILSKSSFSIVPALLHKSAELPAVKLRATGADSSQGSTRLDKRHRDPSESAIVYTDFWVHPLPFWTRVPAWLQHDASIYTREIGAEHCSPPSPIPLET